MFELEELKLKLKEFEKRILELGGSLWHCWEKSKGRIFGRANE